MSAKITNEDLNESLDGLAADIWELQTSVAALHKALSNRDKHNALMVKHVERLVKEKEELVRFAGLTELVKRANQEAPQQLFDDEDLARYRQEQRGMDG